MTMRSSPKPELIEIPVEQRKTLLQLTEKTCRWPVGDPGSTDFFFCGGDTVNDLPYCSYHSRVAYQPASDRRRDKRPFRELIAFLTSNVSWPGSVPAISLHKGTASAVGG